LVENSSDFIALSAPDGRLLYMNKAGRELIGLDSSKEVTATRLTDLWHPETMASSYGRTLTRPLKDVWLRFDGQLKHLVTGEAIAVDCNIFSVPASGKGGTPALACCLRDIRQQRRAEEARARLATIVESSLDAILSQTLDGTIISWNEG